MFLVGEKRRRKVSLVYERLIFNIPMLLIEDYSNKEQFKSFCERVLNCCSRVCWVFVDAQNAMVVQFKQIVRKTILKSQVS